MNSKSLKFRLLQTFIGVAVLFLKTDLVCGAENEIPRFGRAITQDSIRFFQDSVRTNSKGLPSLWGGGELTGVMTSFDVPKETVTGILSRAGLKIPGYHQGPTYPIILVFGEQVGVRPLSHQFYNNLPFDRNPLSAYREVAFLIPGVIFNDTKTRQEFEVTYMPKVILTSQNGADLDRAYLGFEMEANGVEIDALNSDLGDLEYRVRIKSSEFSFLQRGLELKVSPLKHLRNTGLNLLSGMGLFLGQPLISFPVSADRRPRYSYMPEMFSAMLFDSKQLGKSRPVQIDLEIQPETLPGLPKVSLRGQIGFTLDAVPWVLSTHHMNYDTLLLDRLYTQLSPWGRLYPSERRRTYREAKTIFDQEGHGKLPEPALNKINGSSRILVLGGTGAIGAGVVEYLAARGFQVVAVGRKSFDELNGVIKDRFQELRKSGRNLEYVSLDVSEALLKNGVRQRQLKRLMSEANIVIQAAEPYPVKEDGVEQALNDVDSLIQLLQSSGFAGSTKKRVIRIGSPVEFFSQWRKTGQANLVFAEYLANSARTELEPNLVDDSEIARTPVYRLPYFRFKVASSRKYRDSGLAFVSVNPSQVISQYADHDMGELPMIIAREKVSAAIDFPVPSVPVVELAQVIEASFRNGKIGRFYPLTGTPLGSVEQVQRVFAGAGLSDGPIAIGARAIDPQLLVTGFDTLVESFLKRTDLTSEETKVLLMSALLLEMNHPSEITFRELALSFQNRKETLNGTLRKWAENLVKLTRLGNTPTTMISYSQSCEGSFSNR